MMHNRYEQLFRMYRLINLNEIRKLENLIKKKKIKYKKRNERFLFLIVLPTFSVMNA